MPPVTKTVSTGFRKLKWHPTHDLVACIGNDDKNLWCYRASGARVFNLSYKNEDLLGFTWFGEALLMVTSTCVRVHDIHRDRGYTIGIVSEGDVCVVKAFEVECTPVSVDILETLPRLTPLPNSSELFTVQMEPIETLKYFIITDDLLHVILDCGIVINTALPQPKGNIISLFKQGMLVKQVSGYEIVYYSFEVLNMQFLPQITRLLQQMQLLLEYIQDSARLLYKEDIQPYTEFQRRITTGMSDTLLDELLKLIYTGTISSDLEDWFENSLGDKNLKRWAKLAETAYSKTKLLCFGNIITAAKRFLMVCTQLKAYLKSLKARQKPDFDIDITKIDRLENNISSIIKWQFDYLAEVNKEDQASSFFLEWLCQIIFIIKGDKREKQNIDLDATMEYIENLPNSKLVGIADYDVSSLMKDTLKIIDEFKSFCERSINFEPPIPLGDASFISSNDTTIAYIKDNKLSLFDIASRKCTQHLLTISEKITNITLSDQLFILAGDRVFSTSLEVIDIQETISVEGEWGDLSVRQPLLALVSPDEKKLQITSI